MCMRAIGKMFGMEAPKMPSVRQIIPAADNGEANREADMEAALRRRRRGAAADILTGPAGIPSTTSQLGDAR